MDMTWVESILYGLIAGLTEILPVSSQAHEALLAKLFGFEVLPLVRIFVHTAIWEALYLSLRHSTDRMLQERELARIPPKYRERQPDPIALCDLRFLRTALIAMLVVFVAYPFLNAWRNDLSKAALFLGINGVILYIPATLMSGNKDSRSMTGLDGLIVGICGGLAVLPGVSNLGTTVSASSARGADREQALGWALHLLLGFITAVVVYDAYLLLRYGAGPVAPGELLCCALASVTAFCGAAAGIRMMRFLAVRAGFTAFSYYSWGAALFSFIMYLSI